MAATVSQLWRYPVKSMQGQQVDTVHLDRGGVDGDRRWGVMDPASGKVLSAKLWGALLQASARLDETGAGVIVTLPDGSELASSDPTVHDALSEWLDRDVRLERAPEDQKVEFDMGVDPVDDDAGVFQWAGPPGFFVDLADVHVLSTASLATAAAEHPTGQWDVRRFRPTALVELDDEGYPEDAWVGSDVTIGGATLTALMPTVRCAMPTRPQPGGLDRDLEVSKTLARVHQSNLGIYANVRSPGPVSVGDLIGPA